MRRIAVINQKGGVGKTTTTANLGAALGMAGLRTLLIDLDPQAHLSLHFGVELADDQPSVYDVLTSQTPLSEVARNVRDRVTLIPADIDLAGVEAELVSVPGREMILREAVRKVEGDYDVMMIDCPPSLGVLTVNALVAATEVMIPLQAQFFALQGLGKLFHTVTLVRQRMNPSLSVSGVVLCLHDSTTRLSGEIVEDLAAFLDKARGTPVAWADARLHQTRIRRNIKLAEASGFGQTVFDYAPRSNGAIDYGALAREIFEVCIPQEEPPPGKEPEGSGAGKASENISADSSRKTEPQTAPEAAPEKPQGAPGDARILAETAARKLPVIASDASPETSADHEAREASKASASPLATSQEKPIAPATTDAVHKTTDAVHTA